MSVKRMDLKQVFLRILDLLILNLALLGFFQILTPRNPVAYQILGILASLTYLAAANMLQIYRPSPLSNWPREAAQAGKCWLVTTIVILLVGFLTKTTDTYSRLLTTSWALATPLLLILLRLLVCRIREKWHERPENMQHIAIAGSGRLARRLGELISSKEHAGTTLDGFYDNDDADFELAGGLTELVARARSGDIDVVYVAMPLHMREEIESLITSLADSTVTLYVVPDLFVSELMHTHWLEFGEITLLSVYDTPFNGVSGVLKRIEDIVLSCIILTLVSPVLIAIAIAVRATSRGPVIFRQKRYGIGGQEIVIWKFRTMFIENNDHFEQATADDHRVTRIGAILRKLSLDELPQFFNVLQGSMSIVGPRPHVAVQNEEYRKRIQGYMLRHKVKPGITGWAQINGWRGETRTLDMMEKRIEFDLAYIRNWSLWFDLKIILLTIRKMFSDDKAY